MDKETFKKFAALVYDRSGITLAAGKEPLIVARLSKRMQTLGIAKHKDYLDHVLDDRSGEEIGHLVDAISTNVTGFFRHEEQFEIPRDLIISELRAGRRRLRIWSAACSSGQEPYSLAMCLLDAAGKEPIDVKILATDISTKILKRAMTGRYSLSEIGDVPQEHRRRFFEEETEGGTKHFHVAPAVRNMVVFRHFNLLTKRYPLRGGLDLIFCRNVMIYFDRETRTHIVGEMSRLLRPGARLVLSPAESLSGVDHPLDSDAASVYRKPGAS